MYDLQQNLQDQFQSCSHRLLHFGPVQNLRENPLSESVFVQITFTAKTMAAPPQNRTGLLIHHTLRCQTDNHETSNKCQPFQDSLFHCKAIAAVIQRWNMSDNRLKYVLRCRPCGKGNHHSSISEPKQYMQTTANQTLSQGNHLFSYCLYGCGQVVSN